MGAVSSMLSISPAGFAARLGDASQLRPVLLHSVSLRLGVALGRGWAFHAARLCTLCGAYSFPARVGVRLSASIVQPPP